MENKFSVFNLTQLDMLFNKDFKQIKTAIKNFKLLIELTLDSIRDFQEGNYENFDPLVGDNACQIRAILYWEIASINNIQSELKNWSIHLRYVSESLNSLKVDEEHSISLFNFFEMNKIDHKVHEIVYLILLGYILTLSKKTLFGLEKNSNTGKIEFIGKERNDVSSIQNILSKIQNDVSKSFCENLIKNAKKELSVLSINFVKQKLFFMKPTHEKLRLEKMLNENVLIDSRGLHHAPFLPAMEILLEYMLKQQIPIVLKIKMIHADNAKEKGVFSILYTVCPTNNIFVPITSRDKKNNQQPAFIIEALSISNRFPSQEHLLQELAKKSIVEIILSNFAAHNQYGGNHKHINIPDSRRDTLKLKAEKEGFCIINPELSRIYHIYVAPISDHV